MLRTEVSAAEQLLAATRNTARVSFIWLSGHKRFLRPEPARHSLLASKLWILGGGEVGEAKTKRVTKTDDRDISPPGGRRADVRQIKR